MDLMVTASTENSITLLWGLVQGPVENYRVSYTSASGVTTEITVPRDINSTTLSGLEPGTEYTITVMAQRGRQQSAAATIDAFTGTHCGHITHWIVIYLFVIFLTWSPEDSYKAMAFSSLHYYDVMLSIISKGIFFILSF